MSISDEFAFIDKIRPSKKNQGSLVMGIGDDAALFKGDHFVEEIVCMDTMVEGVHFTKQTMPSFYIGYKALAANISDIAAMGGTPTYYLVSIAISKDWSEDELCEIYRGMHLLGEQFNMDLIGGDTVSTQSSLVITVTVLGRVDKGKHLLRSHARPGDIVFITGDIGESAAGLSLLLEKGHAANFTDVEQYLVKRHQNPEPRVSIGKLLTQYKRAALNDISDGLASEANEIAEASNVSLILKSNLFPTSEAILAYKKENHLDWSLFGGEDFELVGTLPEADWLDFKQKCDDSQLKVTAIGYVEEGTGKVYLKDDDSMTLLSKKGYNHFNK